jgi:hypothetical protein
MRGWLMPGWFGHVLQRGVILAVLASQSNTLYPASLIVNFEGSEIRFGESSLPIGSSIFVVAPTGTENAFYTSLSQVNSAGAMAGFLSNTSNLKFYNSEPVNYGSDNGGSPDDGTFRGWLDGGLTPGPAQIGTAGNTASRRLFLLISTSANSSFDSTTSFLLLRQRASPNGSDLGVPIDSIETPFFANVSSDPTTGMDVIFGEFLGINGYRLSQAAGYGQITSPLSQTNTVGSETTYQITANNGADRFFATTNTGSIDLTQTNLPVGFSISTNTGVITVATNAVAGTNTIRLVASNSLTTSVATNTLTWVLQASSLTFTTTTNLISGTAGAAISNFTFVSTGTSPTYTADGNLRGLSLSTNGVLSGIPTSVGTNNVTIQASAGGQSGATTFSLAVGAPTISVPGGQIVHTAGTARTVTLDRTSGFDGLSGVVSPPTSGVSFNGTDLVIAADALPLLEGSDDITLTLTASRAVGGTTVSASTTVPLRIVAPVPVWQMPANPEVVVGESFSLQLQTSQSSFLSRQEIRNLDPLPPGLALSTDGLIRGINRSTSSPDTYETRFVADTTQYKGGGVYTSPPITFLLRNTPPVITSASRAYAGVLHKKFSYTLQTYNNNHVDSEILGVLPSGVVSRKSGSGNSTIILEGYPTAPGIYKNVLVAKNYLRPGNTSTLQETSMELVTYVFGKDASVKQELNSASLTTLVRGVAIDTNTPLRLTSGALSEGTYVVASSTSFRPISRPNDQRYEFLPGILLDPYTGIISGTPSTSGTFQVTVSFMNARKIEKITVTLNVQ